MEQLFTMEEAAAIIRCPVSTLRYWRGRGEGPPAFKIGRRVVYRETELRGWIDHAQLGKSA
jgi:hypothetical protein